MPQSIDNKVLYVKGTVDAQHKKDFVFEIHQMLRSLGWRDFVFQDHMDGNWTRYYTVNRQSWIDAMTRGVSILGTGCLHTKSFEVPDSEGRFELYFGAPSEVNARVIRDSALGALERHAEQHGVSNLYKPDEFIGGRII